MPRAGRRAGRPCATPWRSIRGRFATTRPSLLLLLPVSERPRPLPEDPPHADRLAGGRRRQGDASLLPTTPREAPPLKAVGEGHRSEPSRRRKGPRPDRRKFRSASGRHAVALLEGTVMVDGIDFREALEQVESARRRHRKDSRVTGRASSTARSTSLRGVAIHGATGRTRPGDEPGAVQPARVARDGAPAHERDSSRRKAGARCDVAWVDPRRSPSRPRPGSPGEATGTSRRRSATTFRRSAQLGEAQARVEAAKRERDDLQDLLGDLPGPRGSRHPARARTAST